MARWSTCPTPRAAWAWRRACWANRWSRLCRSCRPITTGCASCTPAKNRWPCGRWHGPAPTRPPSTGRVTSRPNPPSLAGASSGILTWPNWSLTSTGRRFSRPGIWPENIRPFWMTRWWARRRARCLPTQKPCCAGSSTTSGSPPTGCWASGPPTPCATTTSSCMPTNHGARWC